MTDRVDMNAPMRAWRCELDGFLGHPILMELGITVKDGRISSTMQNLEYGITLRVRDSAGGDALAYLSADDAGKLSLFMSQCAERLRNSES